MTNEKKTSGSSAPAAAAETEVRAPVAGATSDTEVVPILAEELSVAKEVVETGRVRLNVVTRTHEELVDEMLTDEIAEVEHVAIGKPVDSMPQVRREGDTTIVPVVEEEVVVQRRLVLKEEIRIRLVRTARRHQERVAVHRQEAIVTRIPSTVEPPDEPGNTGDKAGSIK